MLAFILRRLLQAVLGAQACFQVNGSAGLEIDVNVATPSGVICAGTVEVDTACRVKLAQNGSECIEFNLTESHIYGVLGRDEWPTFFNRYQSG